MGKINPGLGIFRIPPKKKKSKEVFYVRKIKISCNLLLTKQFICNASSVLSIKNRVFQK